VVNDAPMYSISYYKPQRMVRLTWLLGTTAMTDQDFKGALEAFRRKHSATQRSEAHC